MALAKVVVASGTGDVAAVAAKWNLKLVGFSVSEDAGATAAVEIYDGVSSSGELALAPINLAANGFGMWGIARQGIPCHNGIFVNRLSGTTTVVLYIDRP
jgi:hypothetical protein